MCDYLGIKALYFRKITDNFEQLLKLESHFLLSPDYISLKLCHIWA